MSGGATGGLVARAFESMLKECSNTKFSALQSAIQTCLDSGIDFNQQSNIGETKQVPPTAAKQSNRFESDSGVEKKEIPSAAEDAVPTSRNSGSITTDSDAELVLNPLRLAFETKNTKLVELALDCFHKLIVYNHLEGDPGLDNDNNSRLLTGILNMVLDCVDNSTPDSITLQVMKVLLTAIASSKVRVHGAPLLGAIRVCFNIALTSKSPINQATSRATLTQMLSIVFRQMESDVASSKYPENEYGSNSSVAEVSFNDQEDPILSVKHINTTSMSSEGIQNLVGTTDIKDLEAVLQKAVDREDDNKAERGTGQTNLSVAQLDALVLFRTLCKMVMKEGNDDVTAKNRILALELIQGILVDCGDSVTKNFQFIDSLRGHLSYALLQASVSQSPVLFQHAAGIFSVILLRFRESLKAEILVFFSMIVLKVLDGSDLNQKIVVLRTLEKICKDPQMLVDLYLNYDCDNEAPNLFSRMVAALSKLAQGTQNVDPKSSAASQTATIKTSSLQGLVNILKSLVIWEKAHRKPEKQNDNNKLSQVSTGKLDESKGMGESLSNIDELKVYESTVEASVSEFNQQPEKGIEHLISSELLEKKPASVAQFLHHTPKLDKARIGDYLGQQEEFPVTVMHSYMESINFSGMKIDNAIHEFLQGFEIPGEAQKVDRIMETFAERYCSENPGLFKNADTAYVLAYAIIMLKADAHYPTGWPKMSKNDFIHMNTSSAEESLPQEHLEQIYDDIVKEEITMHEDPSLRNHKQKLELNGRGGLLNILNLAFPRGVFSSDSNSENEAVLNQIQSVIKDQTEKKGVFYTSNRIEILCPMIEVVGWPLLATFSVAMGEADKARISFCMEGFKEGIRITYALRMDTIRYAFLTSLLRYNFLHAPRDLRGKNVEALRTLLDLCHTDIDALQDSWSATLECISRLEYVVSRPSITATIMQGSNQISRDAILSSLRELSGKATDQVFVNSVKLPSESVVEFFAALCSVSAEELKQTPPRIYSLQKIVEISYYNMTRIRMVWARIWSILAQHFIYAGSHADEKVAIYAIDSLQRIGMKYLEHAELSGFTFQKGILKPFVVLMQSSQSESIRRLILGGIVQIIRSRAGLIKSGWQSIFMIFTMASNDGLEQIVESAFENVEQVILEHFNQVIVDCFMDCMNCLIGFANNKSSVDISLKAIALLRISEDRLSEGLTPVGYLKPIDSSHITVDETCKLAEHYMLPMLSGLSKLISDPRSEVSNCALEVLFDLLNERGSIFSSAFWESVFHEILFPIFDHVRNAGKANIISSGEWLPESTYHALQLLCDLFNTFYKDVCFMLPPLLSLLLDCAKKTDQSVVSISLGALVHLIEVGGHQFTPDDWVTLLESLKDAVSTTQPRELLNDPAFENGKHDKVLSRDLDSASLVSGDSLYNNHGVYNNGTSAGVTSVQTNGNENAPEQSQETVRPVDLEGSQDVPSPSARAAGTDGGSLLRSQTFGQKIMGNMRDNLFMRSFTSKPNISVSDVATPSSPAKHHDANKETDSFDEEESPTLATTRSKCITQLLLLGSIDGIQKKYWNKLSSDAKITMMEIVFSILEFAASYNSYDNLRLRMHQTSGERPPLNLLRQELTGTSIYLEILLKTAEVEVENDEAVKEEKLGGIAVKKLVSFCEQVLKEASEFQSSMEETNNMEIHRVLELRSPVIVKVLKGMCQMDPQIFKDHLRDFYPCITKLVCCEQMEVRGALADLFSMQMSKLLP